MVQSQIFWLLEKKETHKRQDNANSSMARTMSGQDNVNEGARGPTKPWWPVPRWAPVLCNNGSRQEWLLPSCRGFQGGPGQGSLFTSMYTLNKSIKKKLCNQLDITETFSGSSLKFRIPIPTPSAPPVLVVPNRWRQRPTVATSGTAAFSEQGAATCSWTNFGKKESFQKGRTN